MTTENIERIVDGDGHLVEDHQGIWERMPEAYRDRSFVTTRGPFPPNDHLHAANRHFLPEGAFARVGREGWIDFLQDVGVDKTVLYTSNGLAFGRVVSRDWAIELARAYNNWVYDEYVNQDSRFQAMGLVPLQEPAEAVIELRRIVKELGFAGAMLPGTGALQLQNHLGDPKYWPIYEEADRLGCAIGIHGGVHDHMGLDDMSPYAPVNALGHPFGQMVNFAASSSTACSTSTPTRASASSRRAAHGSSVALNASSAPGTATSNTTRTGASSRCETANR